MKGKMNMKILVTGAKGFLGKNLVNQLKNQKDKDIFEAGRETPSEILDMYCKNCDVVIHLAGVNRPINESEYMEGNFGSIKNLTDRLQLYSNTCKIIFASSIQAAMDNPYGRSKKAGEDLLLQYGEETKAKILIYRFPNIFGKWCKPDYNSVITTYCYNISRGKPIYMENKEKLLTLAYIDDVVDELIKGLDMAGDSIYGNISTTYTVTLSEIGHLLISFHENRRNFLLPDMSNEFTKKLYSTYLSYLPEDSLCYPLKTNLNEKGSFTEFIKGDAFGQVSINILKPGIIKGNHWHQIKNEKFLIVSGEGKVLLQKLGSREIIEYRISGKKQEVLDIPPGYTHNIMNIGDTDMILIIWANEMFDSKRPDTYHLPVKEEEGYRNE